MEKFQSVLLKVWREACRHIEIRESVETIAPMLLGDIPMDQLYVRRIDRQRRSIETVALGFPAASPDQQEARTECSASEMKKLIGWCTRGKLVDSQAAKRRAEALAIMLPDGVERSVLVGPLGKRDAPSGVLVFVAPGQRTFSARHRALAEALLEPFSAALDNDHQVRETDSLRKAAEAENRSLLARLGRKKLADTIVGAESGLQMVMERVELVAQSDVPVLIFGETGTGKELIARAIHARSRRCEGPVIRVNCGAIPSELIDSELFGHERGAFTGAVDVRKGWFERADGGTLFLDEIGELPAAAQVRFLRILQDGWLERVGGQRPINVDVRVVAATHRDLAGMVAGSEFREDLWYRLAVFPIVLPPLRERAGDIAELARYCAERAATRFGLPLVLPSREDIDLLGSYAWPGNVRELAAVIDRAAILGNGERLEVAKALGVLAGPAGASRSNNVHGTAQPRSPADVVPLDSVVRQHVQSVLTITHGRIEGPQGAAALLEVNPHTLRARMRKLGIDWRQFRDSDVSSPSRR